MPFYIVNGLPVHINMGRRKAPAPCMATVERNGAPQHCRGISEALCDWPVAGETCDMPICATHAYEVGKNLHYCPKHLAEHRAAVPELF